jgi:TrpR-related protein YerC/YecD
MAKEQDYSWADKDVDFLCKAVLSLKNVTETRDFFRDLFTENEIHEFSMRFKVAQMLTEKVTYLDIEQKTGMSSTTIARVHKWLKNGNGGYQMILKRLKQ